MRDGSIAGFKYFDLTNTKEVAIEVRGQGKGEVLVMDGIDENVLATIPIKQTEDYNTFQKALSLQGKTSSLYFKYKGSGFIDFKSFSIG